jgi:hypothetical protein
MIGLLFLSAAMAMAADPPGRVARLDYINGSVSVQPNGTEEWAPAVVNRPLTNADNIWADKSSRAELSVATGVLRMSSETSLTLSNISDNTVQVTLHQGTLNLRVRRLSDGETYEVDTPNLAFMVQKSGEYRFDVDSNADTTQVTVWKGEGDVTGDSPAIRLHAHDRGEFSGTRLAHQIHQAGQYDGFDDWCHTRDQRQDRSMSEHYVAPGVIGYEDLDGSGTWRVIEPYGPVWVPVVAVGWAPYRFGHWVWVSPWGWTWVDAAPWGFAPFHYGRWVYWGGAWGWVPGPAYVRPVYAPALVAWFGGPGFGVGFSFGVGGGVGWVPLGFREPFYPYYGVSRSYFQNVNISNTRIVNITNVTNNYFVNPRGAPVAHYANASAPGGVVAVPRQVLETAQPVSRAAVNVPAHALANMRSVNSVPVQPTRISRLGAGAGTPSPAPPARAMARPVISRSPAAPAGTARSAGPTMASPAASSASTGRYVPRPPQRVSAGTPPYSSQPKAGVSGTPSSPVSPSTHTGAQLPAVASRANPAVNNGRVVPRPGASTPAASGGSESAHSRVPAQAPAGAHPKSTGSSQHEKTGAEHSGH